MSQTSPRTIARRSSRAASTVTPARPDSRPLRRTGGLATAVVVAAVLSSAGCSYLSPTPITTPYNASDGINAVLNGTDGAAAVRVSNLLVVGTTPGGAGEVVGTLSNESAAAVTVSLTADQGSGGPVGETRVVVPAGGVSTLGPVAATTRMPLVAVPAGPGGVIAMTVATAAIGSTPLTVPVLAPTGPYASLRPRTATPTPTPTPTPTITAPTTGKATPTSGASADTDSTQRAEPTPTAKATTSPTP